MSNTEAVSEQLNRIEAQVGQLNEALLGSTRPGAPPGLIRRQDDTERDVRDIRAQLAEIRAGLRETQAGVAALKVMPAQGIADWGGKIALALCVSFALWLANVAAGRIGGH